MRGKMKEKKLFFVEVINEKKYEKKFNYLYTAYNQGPAYMTAILTKERAKDIEKNSAFYKNKKTSIFKLNVWPRSK